MDNRPLGPATFTRKHIGGNANNGPLRPPFSVLGQPTAELGNPTKHMLRLLGCVRVRGRTRLVCGRRVASHSGCLVSGGTSCAGKKIFSQKRRSQTALWRPGRRPSARGVMAVPRTIWRQIAKWEEASAGTSAVEALAAHEMLQGTRAAPQSEGGLYGATWLCRLGSCNWVWWRGWGADRRGRGQRYKERERSSAHGRRPTQRGLANDPLP